MQWSSAMSRQPHDALFKAVFSQPEHAAALLATLVPAPFAARVDWTSLAPLPANFVDARLAQRHSDLLFSVRTVGGTPVLVYLLMEHQSEPDEWMALRLLGYVDRIWQAWRRDHPRAERIPAVLPLVVHHGRGGWTAASSLSELYDLDVDAREALAPHLLELRFLLDDLGAIPTEQLERRPITDLGRLALLLLQRIRISPDVVADVWRWMDMLRRVRRGPGGVPAFRLLMSYIVHVLGTAPAGMAGALEAGLGPEVREEYMAAAQELIDQGREEGRAEGRAEGQAEMLLRLLEARFGPLPPGTVARVRGASPDQLVRCAERTLTAAGLSDVFSEV
jgi:hypothetical protein